MNKVQVRVFSMQVDETYREGIWREREPSESRSN